MRGSRAERATRCNVQMTEFRQGEIAMGSRHGLEIRAATPADAPGLSDLLALAGHPIPPRTLADRLDGMRHGSGTILLALEWGPPSGLVQLHWYRPLHRPQPVAQVTALFVAEDDRRRGLARLLVKAASQAARVAGCGTLEMLTASDPVLHAFCLATGFVPAGGRHERALRKKA